MARRESRFRKRDSDRSGFTYKRRQMVKDKGILVGPDEFDTPPPSDKPLGGEGDVSPGDTRAAYTSFTGGSTIRLQYVTAAGGINYEQKVYASGEQVSNGFFHIVGSNSTVNISKDPQITRGIQGDKLTLECVGSSVTLEDGNGLSLRKIFTMNSGAIINLFYNGTDNLWIETSRSHRTENIGEL